MYQKNITAYHRTVGGAYHNIWMIIIWYIEYHTTSIGHNFTAYYEIQLRPFLTITISLSFSRSFNWHVHFAENHICLKLYSLWYQYLDMDPFIKWAYKSNYSVLTHEKILLGLPVPVGSCSFLKYLSKCWNISSRCRRVW